MKSQVPVITEIRFKPIPQKDSHIGFVSFLYDGRIRVNDVAVHALIKSKTGGSYRLVYPRSNVTKETFFYPIDRETQEVIDKDVSSYIANVLRKGGHR